MWLCRLIFTATFMVAVSSFVISPFKSLNTSKDDSSVTNVGWLSKQELVLKFFKDVNEETTDPVLKQLAEEFSLSEPEKYKIPNVIEEVRSIIDGEGFLTKNAVFSEFNQKHYYQFNVLCRLFYASKSFHTFITDAAWARTNVNVELFVDAFYAALMKRRDCETLYYPPPYEVLPYFFVNIDVFNKLVTMTTSKIVPDPSTVHIDANIVTIDMNYTGAFFNNDGEDKLAYFREDIGLNAYYYLNSLKNKPWLNITDLETSDTGRWWYFTIQQLNARYNLERLANGFDEVEAIAWDKPLVYGYDPKLYYKNMMPFQAREASKDLEYQPCVVELMDIEKNIFNDPAGLSENTVMNNVLKIFMNIENSARILLSSARATKDDETTTLDHYATSMRDPAFWQINKHILDLGYSFMKTLQPYTKDDLYYPGVAINSIDIKKIQTFYDYFVSDVIEASESTNYFTMKVGQPRLNHKPFSMVVNVTSTIAQKARVKVFLGPKSVTTGFQRYNSDLNSVKRNFFLIDSFDYNMVSGTNVIVKKSTDIKRFSSDLLSSQDITNKIKNMAMGIPTVNDINNENMAEFPSRLVIPKGNSAGFPLRLYVIIAPYVKNNIDGSLKATFNDEVMSFGYPFDREIVDVGLYLSPNMAFKDILVFHKGDNKVLNYGGTGITKTWYWTEPYVYDSSKSFDYKNKKEEGYKSEEMMSNFENKKNTQVTSPEIDTSILDQLENIKIFGNDINSHLNDLKKFEEQIEPTEMSLSQSSDTNDETTTLADTVPLLRKSKNEFMINDKIDPIQMNSDEIAKEFKKYRDLVIKAKKAEDEAKEKDIKTKVMTKKQELVDQPENDDSLLKTLNLFEKTEEEAKKSEYEGAKQGAKTKTKAKKQELVDQPEYEDNLLKTVALFEEADKKEKKSEYESVKQEAKTKAKAKKQKLVDQSENEDKKLETKNLFEEADEDLDNFVKDIDTTLDKLKLQYPFQKRSYYDENDYYPDYRVFE